MFKKKNFQKNNKLRGVINGAGEIIDQKIVTTLEENYMPYAMSVILSRAIPQIDGFKPSHRKLLFTMYKMGLLGSTRTKSANIVGQTMKLNPHGDAAIYDTMVRLSRGYEALLHPYVDSKGNFGKFYSRDMMCAASRYTEAKLDEICEELFKDIDKDTVNFVNNYDNTLKEPVLLPTSFPAILINANTGIAVGMASSICSFNLREICNATIMFMQDPNFDISKVLLAPDFVSGGSILYNKKNMQNIFKTGKGSVKIRARYAYDPVQNCIDINNIPPTTNSEAIIEKIIELIKKGEIKEISDIRDETGIEGLKITIDLKKNINPDKLMWKLYKLTPLEDNFYCNFNVLIDNSPKVLGVKNLLNEWIKFRIDCVKRRTSFELSKQTEKMHLLSGLKEILTDIDKAIKIIQNSNEEILVIPNLMRGFNIDEVQANYVAEMKLRHLNKEFILKKINEIKNLENSINNLHNILNNESEIKDIIAKELQNISKKYGAPRKTMLIYKDNLAEYGENEKNLNYTVNLFFTKQFYLKKITPQSLKMSANQKLKDNDEISQTIDANNNDDLLFFTDKYQIYKTKVSDFQDTKASQLGEYVPAKLKMNSDEKILYVAVTSNYDGEILYFFENGKIAKIKISVYKTKTNRKKLVNAFSDKSNLISIKYINSEKNFILTSTSGKILIVNTNSLQAKMTKTTQGNTVMSLRKGQRIISANEYASGSLADENKYMPKNLPSSGYFLSIKDNQKNQLTL